MCGLAAVCLDMPMSGHGQAGVSLAGAFIGGAGYPHRGVHQRDFCSTAGSCSR